MVKQLEHNPVACRRVAGVVVVLALLVRLFAAWWFNQRQPDSTAWLIGDEPGYNNTALELLAGQGYTWVGRVPLYPLWVAAVHWLTGTSYHALRYVQAVPGAGAVLLTWLLGRRVFGDVAGLAAALVAAFSYVLIHQSLHLLSEILFTPLVLIVTLALWHAWREPTRGRFLWVGLWVGISALVRPTLLFLPLFLLLPLGFALGLRRGTAGGGLILAATLLTVSPWLVRNRIRYDAWFPLATSNAFLWQGSPEYYHLLRDQGYTYRRVWGEVIYGPGWREHNPTTVEGDRWWTARAIRSIRSEPFTYLRYAAEKVVTFWVGDPNADWSNERVFSYGALRRGGFGPRAAVLVMLARALPILALVAVILLWGERRRLLPIYAILIYATLLHALAHAEARLSEPFQPLLLVLVAGAVVRRGLPQARREGAPAA